MIKGRPPRLERIHERSPLFFVTFCTRDRRPFQKLTLVHQAFLCFTDKARSDYEIAVGRYVIMPDHLHFFVQGGQAFILSSWVGGLKRSISVALSCGSSQLWQPGFFDHVLRSVESYAQKWEYVRDNPVRAGLVKAAEEWPYQGEVMYIDRA